jgi:hypothetical protein
MFNPLLLVQPFPGRPTSSEVRFLCFGTGQENYKEFRSLDQLSEVFRKIKTMTCLTHSHRPNSYFAGIRHRSDECDVIRNSRNVGQKLANPCSRYGSLDRRELATNLLHCLKLGIERFMLCRCRRVKNSAELYLQSCSAHAAS